MNRGETPASFSEPPIAIGPATRAQPAQPTRSATFVDVAMRLVNDGPMYAVIALVGVLALKGQASASEMVITALGALLARSWPRAVQVAGAAAVFIVVGAQVAFAPQTASASSPRPRDLVVANAAQSIAQESKKAVP